jgi:hypothetical protein|tara:strand:+ start:3489 stop:5264 length:1776 start_codon:yes stop_codon:yes gene_type:complete
MADTDDFADGETRKLLEIIKVMVDRAESFNVAMATVIQRMTETSTQWKNWEYHLKDREMYGKERERHDKEMKTKQRELLTHQEKMKRFHEEQKGRIQKEHDQAVDRHIRLRHSLDSMNISVGLFKNLIGGIGVKAGGGMVFGNMAGLVQAQMRATKLEGERDDSEKQFKSARRKYNTNKKNFGEDDDKTKTSYIRMNEKQADFLHMKKLIKQESETGAGKTLKDSPASKKFAQSLEGLGNFVEKNKNGIIISAFSLGIFVGMLKKLLSVSPMLQKMLEVMNLAFTLVLRPFGDFIGFFLRPIAMLMLATVMPFFKEAYPMLAKLGNLLGEGVAEFIKTGNPIALLQALGLTFETIKPERVLAWIFGDRENNTAGGVGATGAVLSAGAVGAVGGAGYLGKKGFEFLRGGGANSGDTKDTKDKGKVKGKAKGQQTLDNNKKMENLKKSLPKLNKVAPHLAKIVKPLLHRVPLLGTALMAGSIGFEALRSIIGEEEYAKMYKSYEWMGGAQDLFMSEHKLMAGGQETFNSPDPMFGGSSMSNRFTPSELGSQTNSGGDQITTSIHIDSVSTAVNLNEIQDSVTRALNKNGKSRY